MTDQRPILERIVTLHESRVKLRQDICDRLTRLQAQGGEGQIDLEESVIAVLEAEVDLENARLDLAKVTP